MQRYPRANAEHIIVYDSDDLVPEAVESTQSARVQSSLHDFWSAADNNKPKLPPDLWAKIAAYVLAHFFEEPIAVGESSDLYYPISLYYTRVKERENKENIQCISTTCKTFHDEVKKLLNMDRLVFLESFWQQVIIRSLSNRSSWAIFTSQRVKLR
jgi:hypothetical protein